MQELKVWQFASFLKALNSYIQKMTNICQGRQRRGGRERNCPPVCRECSLFAQKIDPNHQKLGLLWFLPPQILRHCNAPDQNQISTLKISLIHIILFYCGVELCKIRWIVEVSWHFNPSLIQLFSYHFSPKNARFKGQNQAIAPCSRK